MKDIWEKIKKAFFNKQVFMFILGTLLGAFGVTVGEDTLADLICMIPGLGGC